jgi:adenosylmethionine-8-amino-7-oxononanoate aminotransferase
LASHILHRELGREYPRAVRGEGCWLIDDAGRRYLDAAGGAAVCSLGHGHPRVVAAIREQAGRLSYAHTGSFSSEPAEALAEHLIARAPAGISHAMFVSSGGEAVETALKLARQYALETGQPQRRHIIARRQSYHGNTLGALAIGGNAARRAPYAPLLIEAHHISPCYPYREQRGDETPEAYGRRLADELDATIRALGTDSVLCFVAETVAGATLGAAPPVPGYFQAVRAVCDRHGVLLILDEVMCGMGRCGTLHACEAEGVSPDLLTLAKGLGGGHVPIGAVLVSQRIRDAIAAGSGTLAHGFTYMGHPLACAAALAVQQVIDEEGLLAQVVERGAQLRVALEDAFGSHPHVGQIRGRGLLLALELVQDRVSKQPFDPALKLHARVKQAALDAGLAVYPGGGCVDGVRGDHVLLAPPYRVSSDEVAQLVGRLSLAVRNALQTLGGSASPS